MHKISRPLIVTSGEPAGIGPELCAHLAWKAGAPHCVVLGDQTLLAERCAHAAQPVTLRAYTPGTPPAPGVIDILHTPLACPSQVGTLNPVNARYVLAILDRAIEGCQSGEFGAMVTAPIHKGVICDAGVPFTGHTEYLAQRTQTSQVVMMLVGGGLRVALATTHLALSAVPAALTPALLTRTLEILHHDLVTRFGIPDPHILVAGLNPHAGESGHMGQEEIKVITPTLDRLRSKGMRLTGPLPADTLFTPHHLKNADAVLTMYHDQGLPVLKYASFGGGVNLTLGLPIIRTSVDHGTALELAGTHKAHPGSLLAAVTLAQQLCT